MTVRLPIVIVSVDAEADAIRAAIPNCEEQMTLVVSGIGRTNGNCPRKLQRSSGFQPGPLARSM